MLKKRLFTIILFVSAGLLISLLLLFPKIQIIREDNWKMSKYSEDMATFRWSIFRYLDKYYDEHKSYPISVDVNMFDTFENSEYRRIFDKTVYHSDMNSYEITFNYPHPADMNGKDAIFVAYGLNGKRIDPNYYVFDKKTGNREKSSSN